MTRPAVLVVDRLESRRRELVRGLTGYGYEVIGATGADEGQRFASGLCPGLVAVEADLVSQEDPFALRAQAGRTGTRPPVVLLFGAAEFEDLPQGVLAVPDADCPAATLLARVRTALLADELGLDANPRLSALHGDLRHLPLLDLLPKLQRAVATGRVEISGGELALEEGEVVGAWAGAIGGVKAFARLVRMAAGTFRVVLGPPTCQREIFMDLLSLMAIAMEDQHLYEETRAALPSLSSRLHLVMGPAFFATQFSPSQQRVLEAAQGSRTPWHVLDRVQLPDGEALAYLAQLHRLGIVSLEEPEVEVRIVTDSAAALPSALARHLAVQAIPLTLVVGQKVLREGVDIGGDELYNLVGSRHARRHSVRIEPAAIDEVASVYRAVVGRNDVVSVHTSEGLSETVLNARAAAQRGREDFRAIRGDGAPAVEVVDSTQVSVGQALLVVAAARMALRGIRAREIRERIEAMRERIHTLFVAGTPIFLAQAKVTGRGRSWLAGLLGFKPIMGVTGGRLAPLDLVHTGRTALPRAVELLAGRVVAERPVLACVAHAAAPVMGAKVRQLLNDSLRISEIIEAEVGAAAATLLGGRCIGVALLQPTPEEEPLIAPLPDER